MKSSPEEVVSAFESVLNEMSVVDTETMPFDELMQVSLSEDVGLHCSQDFEEFSDALESQGVEISADRLEELDTLQAIYHDLTYGRD